MIRVVKDSNEIAEAIAQLLFALAQSQGNSPIHIALSGGNTPKSVFSYLTVTYGEQLACPRFHFWWGDERCVPPSHPESNFKWAYELWLKPIGIADENIHRVKGEEEPEKEAIRYANELATFVKVENCLPVIDLNILGLGDDGHTASIFPNQMHLLSSSQWCEVATHPVTGQKRITLTGNVLNNSQMVVFVSTGSGKATMVRNVTIESKPALPASHIKPKSGQILWLLDEGAATALTNF